MLSGQTTGRTLSTREALKQTVLFSAVLLVMLMITFGLLWRAGDIWAATHGHGTPGRWTATRRETGSKMVRWYGDFAPDSGGPVRHDVPMEGYVDPGHGKRTVTAVYRSGTAYVVPGSAQWLALTLIATLPGAAAAFVVWLIVQVWRHPRRRLVG